jgi:hypothetical protein
MRLLLAFAAAVLAIGIVAAAPTTSELPRPTTNSNIFWRGDGETGDFSQWTGDDGNCEVQASRVRDTCYPVSLVGDSDIQLVPSPTRCPNSRYAFKHMIYHELSGPTSPVGGSVIRADLYANQAFMGEVNGSLEGQKQWWGWSYRFPSVNGKRQTWAASYNFNTIADMHAGSVSQHHITPVNLGVRDVKRHVVYFQRNDDRAVNAGGYHDLSWRPLAPLVYDKWYDVVLSIKWGTTTATGHLKLWIQLDGGGYMKKVDLAAPTMDAGDHPYFKEALYSGPNPDGSPRTYTNSVIQDMARRGYSFAAVDPSACRP